MKISIFKNVRDVTAPFDKDVSYCLERIKNGKSKQLIEELRAMSFEDYQKNKSKLPAVCFNGTFKHRSALGLKKKSGLIILDFDKFDSFEAVENFKAELIKDEYIFAAWISPSGKGLKVLVKIPVDNYHKEYFDSLKKHFDNPNWDDSGSDIPRVCYESYDADIYINFESKQWIEIEEPEISEIGTNNPVIPIKSDNRIIENLMTWWNKKYSAVKGERNSNLYKLAIAFNSFGINKSECENVLMKFQSSDFKESEIKTIVKSGYKDVSIYGTKFFEDAKTKQQINKQIISGKKIKDIEKSFPQFSKDEIESCVNAIKQNISLDVFWYYDEEGKIKLSVHKYKFWLQQNNFFKYFPTNSNTYTFIQKERNLIEETNEKRIKDFVLNDLLKRESEGFMPYDFMAASTKYFTSDFLSLLESAEIKLKEDTSNECYLYFKNSVVKVQQDNIEIIDYIDVDGCIWKKQIIDREFVQGDHHESIFRNFLYLIAGKNMQKYNSFKSVIGYLLHSFKTSANNKAIIFNDETISENPNGGSGKGVFWNALAQMKKVSSIDGKTFEFTKSFPYQTVSTDTQILVFDDVKKNFIFENLFSLITEGITLEYKGQDAIKLPVTKSPKILITTNYTIGGIGGSFERRKFEVEMSDYFSYKHTPLDEFGHMLFDDWDELEWQKFDNFMINCCQFYLKNGLVKHDFNNLEVRKFIKETAFEFYEWSKESILLNNEYNKKYLYEMFINEYHDFKKWLTQKRFSQWIDSFSKYYKFNIIAGKTSGERWIKIIDGNEVIDENEGSLPF